MRQEARLLESQELEHGLGNLAMAGSAAHPPMPPEGPVAGPQTAARGQLGPEWDLEAGWDKKHLQGQHHVKDASVILSGLHCPSHHGTRLLLGFYLPLQESEVHPAVLVVHLVHLAELAVPGPAC